MPSVVLYIVNHGREALRQRDPAEESLVAAVSVPKDPRQPSLKTGVELAARSPRVGDAPALVCSGRGRNLEVRGVSCKNAVLTILFFGNHFSRGCCGPQPSHRTVLRCEKSELTPVSSSVCGVCARNGAGRGYGVLILRDLHDRLVRVFRFSEGYVSKKERVSLFCVRDTPSGEDPRFASFAARKTPHRLFTLSNARGGVWKIESRTRLCFQ